MPYVEPEVVAMAREVDLLSYLQERDPDQLVRIGAGSFCTREHDSLKISNGKWFWWSRGIGGRSALDYLMAVEGMGFVDAVRDIVGGRPAALMAPARAERGAEPAVPAKRPFRLPPEDGTKAALLYLEKRGIDPEILDALSREGLVYGSRRARHQNVVFVGRDGEGKPRYAAVRSCGGSFKGEAAGSDKRYAFSLGQRGGPAEVHVFESAVDALSYATLRKMEGADWRSLSLVSLGGVPPARPGGDFKVPDALSRWLDEHPTCSEVHLHLDSDDAGRMAARAIAERLSPRVPVGIEPPPAGKDVNDHLLAVLKGREGRGRSRGRSCESRGAR